jgi:hypothetical protein
MSGRAAGDLLDTPSILMESYLSVGDLNEQGKFDTEDNQN